jgi:hypothetical protein
MMLEPKPDQHSVMTYPATHFLVSLHVLFVDHRDIFLKCIMFSNETLILVLFVIFHVSCFIAFISLTPFRNGNRQYYYGWTSYHMIFCVV